MTDTEIIELFFERSDRAIAELEAAHGSAVRRVAMNILANPLDGEECVNDTWFGVWNTIPPLRPYPLRTFVCRIARNLATKKYHANNALKRNSQYDLALDELAECIPDINTIESEYASRELAKTINRFLGTLNYVDRFIFMRRYWYADSIPDIAEMTNMNYNTVSVHLHRTKTKLKNQLTKEGLIV